MTEDLVQWILCISHSQHVPTIFKESHEKYCPLYPYDLKI